jgi:hypothetical protein
MIIHHGHLVPIIDLDIFATNDAWFSHSTGHNGSMGGLATSAGQNAPGLKESMYVFGFGLLPNQNDRFTQPTQPFGLVSIKNNFAPSCTR